MWLFWADRNQIKSILYVLYNAWNPICSVIMQLRINIKWLNILINGFGLELVNKKR